MNVEALEAALPAFTVAVLTAATAPSQVHVADEPRAVRKPTVDVHWRYVEETPTSGGGVGRPQTGLRYLLAVTADTATQAQRKTWVRELRAALHFKRVPTGVAGLDHAEVLAARVAPPLERVAEAGGTGGARAELEVLFVGDIHPDDLGA